ncbi:MAG TPA: hypothetical protein VFL15_03910 [Gammaproteobacteria bacterium]|nr:hypothetical protein [Gammaproteobacteria bacterium]
MMRRMIVCFAFMSALVPAAGVSAASASKPIDIRDLMSVTQFHQAGLDKLTPQELASLNAWLSGYVNGAKQASAAPVVAAPKPAAPDASFGSESLPSAGPQEITSRYAGVLKGWTGDTVFTLENGQIWKQAGPGYESDMRLDHPDVVIKKLAFGYLLTLPGHSETVFVKRVK